MSAFNWPAGTIYNAAEVLDARHRISELLVPPAQQPRVYLRALTAALSSPHGALQPELRRPLSTLLPRLKRGMTGVVDHPVRGRRDRTFAGGECVVCEEPLEHTLRNERILQLACSDVAHEACFYEYIKEPDSLTCPACDAPLALDASRGGNVLNIEKLSSIVRALQFGDEQRQRDMLEQQLQQQHQQQMMHQQQIHQIQQQQHFYQHPANVSTPPPPQASPPYRSTHTTPLPWNGNAIEADPGRPASRSHIKRPDDGDRNHYRVGSSGTEYTAGQLSRGQSSGASRRMEYDKNSSDPLVNPGSRLPSTKPPVAAPVISMRSEYPTLNRSRQQQSLTCLVSIEVPPSRWSVRQNSPAAPALPRPQPSNATINSQASASHRRDVSTMSQKPIDESAEIEEEMEALSEDLRARVDNWHGLDYARFGKLRLHSRLRVGKDKVSWQELECYLFSEMLICVKEKRSSHTQQNSDGNNPPAPKKFTLKGSIMIRRHLNSIEVDSENENILTLSLSVAELPAFHLLYENRDHMLSWKNSLVSLNRAESVAVKSSEYDGETNETPEEEEEATAQNGDVLSSLQSSYGANKSYSTAATDYSDPGVTDRASKLSLSLHVPVDMVAVIPVTSSMHGLKISLMRDMLRFIVYSLGERDRLGLVITGSAGGAIPLVGMATKSWAGWSKTIDAVRASGPRDARADSVDGANCAMDLLMQRKSTNPLSSILLVSDLSSSETEGVDFVVSRAEAARVSIYSFGLGIAHKPDALIDMSSRTKGAYVYVKDWMMLRECIAGVLGSLQSVSHQNVVLKLRLPDESPGKFAKISGALQVTKRSSGRESEASLGDLRFGEKRDILVQLIVEPDSMHSEAAPQDAWDSMISNLEALGSPTTPNGDFDPSRISIEEAPVLQADLIYNDVFMGGVVKYSPMPSLLNIMILPSNINPKSKASGSRPTSVPPIPPHPSVVQRRMELLTSDMLTRSLTLVSRGQQDRAQRLLLETRTILQGLGKGGLPPLPPPPTLPPSLVSPVSSPPPARHTISSPPPLPTSSPVNGAAPSIISFAESSVSYAEKHNATSPAATLTLSPSISPHSVLPNFAAAQSHANISGGPSTAVMASNTPLPPSLPSSPTPGASAPAGSANVDTSLMAALEAEIEGALEWILQPTVFDRDTRKAVLQAIGAINSQRAYTGRTALETIWSTRVSGIRGLLESSRAWREGGHEMLESE